VKPKPPPTAIGDAPARPAAGASPAEDPVTGGPGTSDSAGSDPGVSKSRALDGAARWFVMAATLAALALCIVQLFNLQPLGIVLLEGRYLYLLGGVFLALAFLLFPARAKDTAHLPLYDLLLAAATLGVACYFASTAEISLEMGWEYAAPETAQYAALLFWLLILEGTRRAGGPVIFMIVLVFSLYPTFADHMPGPISGFQQPFWDTIPYHLISSESSFGIPMRAFGNLVIGFILFGVVLQRTGGGAFFNDLALGLVGRFRGGAAKVAIFASGFMGSMSGSVISNVLTTGAVSIPAMRKSGFSARYAAATEACASTGGVLMPPIMGATAFVMASFLSRPYFEIALAAAIPSLLYYFGLFVQIDAYAARTGLKGMPAADLPRLGAVFKEGWSYLLVFGLLIFLMIAFRIETLAPFYATALLLVINQLNRRHRLSFAQLGDALLGIGAALAELVAVLLGIGLIVGAFSATGLAGTLVNDLIFLAGGSTAMLLVMGAVTAFVFGMGMTVTACYIFLAVVLAPALTQAGLNVLAVHLFILYYGMVSYITPPVALGAFAAATLARTSPIGAGLEAMRLGGVIYVAPFFFVLNPALIGVGSASEVLSAVLLALLAVLLIGAGLQRFLPLVGPLPKGAVGWIVRAFLIAGGLIFGFAEAAPFGFDPTLLLPLALAMSLPGLLLAFRAGRLEGG
jgi:TRAP transporter 4TM/12TM fusion protein